MARPGRNFKAPRPMEKATKADFAEWADKFGGFIVKKRNTGEWNEGRDFVVRGVVVGRVQKGDRADWIGMIFDTVRAFGDEADKAFVKMWINNC